MNRKKIFNDPVYGFITVPYGILFDLIEHPYFQRLRRIKQLSLTHYVYPGALHTRFHHALGALHLMQEAITVLKSKGAEISEEEEEAVCIAILLHDIGHGPFSHTLEKTLIDITHESISLKFMHLLNHEFEGKLSLAIRIFENKYPKTFLFQLISGQLDMDRMDYLNRDSFFTGVSEGVISYKRIIKMLDVVNNELVIEEKGIYSIEKFLIARRLMYWQVYLHKTVLCAEQMMIKVFERVKQLYSSGYNFNLSDAMVYFLKNHNILSEITDEVIQQFALLDDHDVMMALKEFAKSEDKVLKFLAVSLLNRNLFRVEMKNFEFKSDYVNKMRHKVAKCDWVKPEDLSFLVFQGEEVNNAYSKSQKEIKIVFKPGNVLPMSESTDYDIHSHSVTKYYLCYPKVIN